MRVKGIGALIPIPLCVEGNPNPDPGLTLRVLGLGLTSQIVPPFRSFLVAFASQMFLVPALEVDDDDTAGALHNHRRMGWRWTRGHINILVYIYIVSIKYRRSIGI